MSELTAAPALADMKACGSGDGVRARLAPTRPWSVCWRARARRRPWRTEGVGISGWTAPQSCTDGVTALGIGPGRWLFLDRPMDQLAPLAGLASLSDHSDGYAVFEVWGPKVREALSRGVPLDLHPGQFSDQVAVTMVAHIGAIIWQSGQDRFILAVFRSYAGSFWHWLSASAAPFGLVVEQS